VTSPPDPGPDELGPAGDAATEARPLHESTLGAAVPMGLIDPAAAAPDRPSRWKILWRVLFLLVSAIALYGLLPQLLDVWTEIPKLHKLNPLWFGAMLVLEGGSFTCQWKLTRTALPMVSWFVAGTAQLVSNAVSKTVPGGGAMGAATGYRMLAVSGVNRGTAGAALAATAIVSNGVLFALPMVAVFGSILSAPVPSDLSVIAWGGALLFIVLFATVFTLVRFERPLWALGRLVERVSGWKVALAAAVGNWGLDYLALVAALYAVGVTPRLSLVLLAYGAAAVLSMIPITPGGLGFVEAGLTATLLAAGVPGPDALLATLAYRVVSYWLPLPAGLVASILFRRRYGRFESAQAESTSGMVPGSA
jgi:uncharacterized membrane protein YbhN (UPF0104 family)